MLRRHYNQIYATCRRLANNEADGQDATQEALIAIVRGLPRFAGQAKFTTWAYRVSTNAALDELRRRSRRPIVGLPEERERQRFVGIATGGRADPAGTVADRLLITEALAELPETFRSAIVLRDVSGLSYKEIGEVLGIPQGTVRSRIARGRTRLAKSLRNPDWNPASVTERQKGQRTQNKNQRDEPEGHTEGHTRASGTNRNKNQKDVHERAMLSASTVQPAPKPDIPTP